MSEQDGKKKSSARKALGRGLDALLQTDARVEAAAELKTQREIADAAKPDTVKGLTICSIEQVGPGRFQPRQNFDEEALMELAGSIKTNGILQPLLVRRNPNGDPVFELIAGERRWRAAQKAGLMEVPIMIKEVDDHQALELSLVENLQREGLNPVEEAEGFNRLIAEFGYTNDELAERVGKDRSTVSNTLRLLKLPKEVREDLRQGRMSAGHARSLLSLENPGQIKRLRGKILKKGISVREAEKMAERLRRQVKQEGAEEESADLAVKDKQTAIEIKALNERLVRALSTQVKVIHGKRGGKIEIKYTSADELHRLVLYMEGQM